MKLKIIIEYGYNSSLDSPFIAKTEINEDKNNIQNYFEVSKKSFEEAELKLIRKIEDIILSVSLIKIPPPKEIEIGE